MKGLGIASLIYSIRIEANQDRIMHSIKRLQCFTTVLQNAAVYPMMIVELISCVFCLFTISVILNQILRHSGSRLGLYLSNCGHSAPR